MNGRGSRRVSCQSTMTMASRAARAPGRGRREAAMPRIRSLKPEFFKHEGLADLDRRKAVGGMPSFVHRIVFEGLWCQADREGRLRDRPRLLKNEITPWDTFDFEQILSNLAEDHYIQRYEADGERFISITTFRKHQKPHIREAKSDIPPPPHGSAGAT